MAAKKAAFESAVAATICASAEKLNLDESLDEMGPTGVPGETTLDGKTRLDCIPQSSRHSLHNLGHVRLLTS